VYALAREASCAHGRIICGHRATNQKNIVMARAMTLKGGKWGHHFGVDSSPFTAPLALVKSIWPA
jgi:hypothetical protein